jgi:hypothetical protein
MLPKTRKAASGRAFLRGCSKSPSSLLFEPFGSYNEIKVLAPLKFHNEGRPWKSGQGSSEGPRSGRAVEGAFGYSNFHFAMVMWGGPPGLPVPGASGPRSGVRDSAYWQVRDSQRPAPTLAK